MKQSLRYASKWIIYQKAVQSRRGYYATVCRLNELHVQVLMELRSYGN